MKKILLDKIGIDKLILRISHEIVDWLNPSEQIAIIGIRTRGDIIAKRIVDNIALHYNIKVQYGVLDVTFHRDDFSSNLGSPKVGPSNIPFDVNDRRIVLIDDVLYTGRTIRAAIDEIFSFGRPSEIKLGVLVDRGHRELPIKADFIGKSYPTSQNEHVYVLVNEIDNIDKIELVKSK